jgi:putative membrane protein
MSALLTAYIPYCGIPPVPGALWQRWMLDPVLLGLLVGGLILVWRLARVRWSTAQRGCFLAGWSVLTLALVSPLCALSVALFSGRATQHMIVLVVAAPFIALALPAAFGPRPRARVAQLMQGRVAAAFPALVFGLLLWAWHLPALYDATFNSDLVYWAMHVTLLGSALTLWMQLLQLSSDRLPLRILLGFSTFVQMGLLGALLTFSPAILYEAHVTTSLAWGHAPLADQQLGGLIMWIPGCSSLLMAMLWAVWRGLTTPVSMLATDINESALEHQHE